MKNYEQMILDIDWYNSPFNIRERLQYILKIISKEREIEVAKGFGNESWHEDFVACQIKRIVANFDLLLFQKEQLKQSIDGKY